MANCGVSLSWEVQASTGGAAPVAEDTDKQSHRLAQGRGGYEREENWGKFTKLGFTYRNAAPTHGDPH